MAQPVIGLTLDHEPAGGWSKFPWYAIRENYCGAVRDAGGLPVLLPHEPETRRAYLDRIDGLIVTGGGFDVDPALFGATTPAPEVKTKDRRTAFELAAHPGALARDMPVLGICGGQQLLNVALGGTLIQHIPDEVPDALPHRQPNPRDEPGHDCPYRRRHAPAPDHWGGRASPSTAPITKRSRRRTRLVIDAIAEDGVVEGIEDPRRRFCLGVQWHPEFGISDGDRRIFRAFIEAAVGLSQRSRFAHSGPAAGPGGQGGERIAKVLARAGLCSRRDAERWIADGRVAVDGAVLTSPAVTVDGRQRYPGRRQAAATARAAAAVALSQAGRAGHHASRREGPADRVRRLAGGAAAADLDRPPRPQFRGAAAVDQ